MEIIAALLIFVLAAGITVAVSVIVQHRRSRRWSHGNHVGQVSDLGTGHRAVERRPPADAREGSTGPADTRDGDTRTREASLREARADELEAVADRERRYAERAEAEARRLRGRDDSGVRRQPPSDPPARRAGVAPEDLDY